MRNILILLLLLPLSLAAQNTTTAKKVIAEEKLQITRDTGKYWSSISDTINSASTKKHATSARAVYNYVNPLRITTGDVTGTLPALTVDGLQGRTVAATAPGNGQVLKWNGSAWAPAADDNTGTTYTAGSGISIVGTTISATDASPTNEIQNLSLVGQGLGISGGTGVNLPVVGIAAGTGISVASASGTVTVTNTGDTDASNDITTSTALGGDLSGTLPNPTVAKLQGRTVSSAAPATGNVLRWDGSQWKPDTISGGGGGGIAEPSGRVLFGTGSGVSSDADFAYANTANIVSTTGIINIKGGASDTIGALSIRQKNINKPNIYHYTSGTGYRMYSRVRNPSAGWNNLSHGDWIEGAIGNTGANNGSANFAPGAVTDTLPNVVWRRGQLFSTPPAMFESDETNWWGAGFLGANTLAPRNVFEKHWQMIDSGNVEHRPLTGYFEKKAGGKGMMQMNVSLFDIKGWNYGQDAIFCLNRNSETRFGQATIFRDSLYSLNLSNISQNSVLHLASANKPYASPENRANFLTIGGNGSFSNVVGIGALYTNTNNGGDLDMLFTTQNGVGAGTQSEKMRIRGGAQTLVGVGISSPIRTLDVGGTTFLRGSTRINNVGDSAALVLKYATTQTTPMLRMESSAGVDLAYLHVFNPSLNPSLVFGKIQGVINATSPANVVVGLTNAQFPAGVGNNTLIGANVANSLNGGYENSVIGCFAGQNMSTGFQNTYIGYQAGQNTTTGFQNIAIGRRAYFNGQGGQNNIAIGANTLSGGTSATINTAIGGEALRDNNSSANVAIGYGAGRLATGSGNIFIGYEAGAQQTTGDNRLSIDNSNTLTPLLRGDFSADSLRVFGSLSAGSGTGVVTSGIFSLYNSTGKNTFFRTNASPDGAITANPGDIAIRSNGSLWGKYTGTTSTGWGKFLNLLDDNSASTGQVLKWNGSAWAGAAESDLSATNEIQTYSHSGTTSYTNTLSSSGGSFTLQAGTGAAISNSSGTVTISGNSAGNGLTLTGNVMSAGATLASGITWTTGDQTVLFTKSSNTGTTTPVAIQVNNAVGNRVALDLRGTGGTSQGQLIVTEEGQTTLRSVSAGYINLDAGTRMFRFSDGGNIELPEASGYSTNEGFLFYKAGKLWYGDGFTNREVASLDKHMKGTYGTLTGTTTIGSAMLANVIDANGGAFTVSFGTDMLEGVEYRVRCERNGTNQITFSAINSCNFHIDGDSTQTRTSFSAGASGTGYEAPYLIYRLTRWGTDIFVDL